MTQTKKCIVGGELFELTELTLTSYIIGELTILDHYESFARCFYGRELVTKAEDELQTLLDTIIHSAESFSEQRCEEIMNRVDLITKRVLDFIELDVAN